MVIFSAEKLSKTFKDKDLFDNLSFGMNDGEKIGLIGNNGTGKTTLMKIIAGLETADKGEVVFNRKATFEYLPQMPEFNTTDTVLHSVINSSEAICNNLDRYYEICNIMETKHNDELQTELEKISQQIELLDGWNHENECKKVLTQLGMSDLLERKIIELSGGQRKRVALAKAILKKPTLLMLDEPTNHLDVDTVQWLQDFLMNRKQAILFVTHDRYFLDAISTKIIEIDRNKLFSFPGNYEQYLLNKENIENVEAAEISRKRSKLRSELIWLSRGAKARRTKAKSRIDWIDDLQNETIVKKKDKFEIEMGTANLGSGRILEVLHIDKSMGNKLLISDFTYVAKPEDRIGIIGQNGWGKSTLLRLMNEELKPDKGKIMLGQNVKVGFFRQEIEDLQDGMSIIAAIREIADFIKVGFKAEQKITAESLLEKFLFARNRHKAQIKTLSGGERRRLALCRILMKNPNILLFDEPTNDFDIQTLNALENFLDDFKGVLISVSHDRAFLDRMSEFIWCFEGDGFIKEYPGNYSDYLIRKESKPKTAKLEKAVVSKKIKTQDKDKLTFKEQRELKNLEEEIPVLEKKKEEIEIAIAKHKPSDYKAIQDLSNNLLELEDSLDEYTLRWMELSEKV